MAAQQFQARRVEISRTAHDLAWIAGGAAVTLSLKELGVKPPAAAVIGTLGLVTVAKLYECSKWCGTSVEWPARIAMKDLVYDVALTSAVVPVLVGKRHGWKAGVATAAAWVATALILKEARWNSP